MSAYLKDLSQARTAPASPNEDAAKRWTTDGPTLTPSSGGKLNVLSGSVATATLPPAQGWLDQSIVVKLDNLPDGVVISRSGDDEVDGETTYTVGGPFGIATFYALDANTIIAFPPAA